MPPDKKRPQKTAGIAAEPPAAKRFAKIAADSKVTKNCKPKAEDTIAELLEDQPEHFETEPDTEPPRAVESVAELLKGEAKNSQTIPNAQQKKRTVYAVTRDTIPFPFDEGYLILKEIIAIYITLKDANNRVRVEWEASAEKLEMYGRIDTNFDGENNHWSAEGYEMEGMRVYLKKMDLCISPTKRTHGVVNATAESSDPNRLDEQAAPLSKVKHNTEVKTAEPPTTRRLTSKAVDSNVKQDDKPTNSKNHAIYAVMKRTDEYFMDEYWEKEEAVALYNTLKDANKRVRAEYESWDGDFKQFTCLNTSFDGKDRGGKYSWSAEGSKYGYFKYHIKKRTLCGAGSEPDRNW